MHLSAGEVLQVCVPAFAGEEDAAPPARLISSGRVPGTCLAHGRAARGDEPRIPAMSGEIEANARLATTARVLLGQ